MKIEREFYVGLRDVNPDLTVKASSLLAYLEDIACMHSELVGFGLSNIDENKRSWVLTSWKVKLHTWPKYNTKIKIRTWSTGVERIQSRRDFIIFDQDDNELGVASSKWLLIDIEQEKFIKITDDVISLYEPEAEFVCDDFGKLKEPESYDQKSYFKITQNMIDVNKHLHNIYYMDIVDSILPEDKINSYKDLEIMYKKEIKNGEEIAVLYDSTSNTVVLKDKEENVLHSIISLK